ncbi:MAG: hypothetical protein JWR16_2552 [Nevskia sp.]|nr:hypothetical protein [Nevskia sp.]
MKFIFGTLGAFLLGSFGWWLGAQWALPAAVIVSAVGGGVGLYYGRRLFDDLLG